MKPGAPAEQASSVYSRGHLVLSPTLHHPHLHLRVRGSAPTPPLESTTYVRL